MDSRKRAKSRRRGAELLELAVSFTALLFLTFGLMEFGQYFFIKHCFEAAVRDGGRVAILPTATQSQMVSTMTGDLSRPQSWYRADR